MRDEVKILGFMALLAVTVIACAGHTDDGEPSEEELDPCERAARALEQAGCPGQLDCAVQKAEPTFWDCIEKNAKDICTGEHPVTCAGGPNP